MHIDIHALQSVPYSNLNRDALGSPKETVYGGKTRTRVSSQSWKRAVRFEVEKQLGETTIRTRGVAGAVAELLEQRGWDADNARKGGRAVMFSADAVAKRADSKQGGVTPDEITDLSRVLFWIPTVTLAELADLCETHRAEIEATALPQLEDKKAENAETTPTGKGKAKGGKKKQDKAAVVLPAESVSEILRRRSPTINLLGRMLAEMPGHEVDGAVLFAHAFTTHETAVDYDFFTAVDDRAQNSGSGHLSTAEFTSGVFYRYSSVNITDLVTNVGSAEDALRTIDTYLRAFCTAMPSGKQRTTGAVTRPDLVHIAVRHQPLSLAAAFEKPARYADGGGYAEPSRRQLADYAHRLHAFIGTEELVWHGHAGIDADAHTALGERYESLHNLITEAMNHAGAAA
ncbi:CRISPR system Cascade subunit CasC [Actinokineospora baliensis]|uniref:type I-E CRISPR-associated protein Cas7/Cse4/CasC n=1 Tax=Actinokineospora baliensis TaxID=547056 RepID=UPI00195B00E4|nr:type I-E CRISPR-associated protein Cas7/Cse4/CasC [Actinokineospora baliensis]MBM7774097.1 CRISPR system Cascade subunit CasC [Actinokineospora baliensis]